MHRDRTWMSCDSIFSHFFSIFERKTILIYSEQNCLKWLRDEKQWNAHIYRWSNLPYLHIYQEKLVSALSRAPSNRLPQYHYVGLTVNTLEDLNFDFTHDNDLQPIIEETKGQSIVVKLNKIYKWDQVLWTRYGKGKLGKLKSQQKMWTLLNNIIIEWDILVLREILKVFENFCTGNI